MPTAHDETTLGSELDPALAGLNKADREETESILKELEGDAPKPEEKPVEPPKPEGEKPDESAKPEGEEGKDGKKPDGEPDAEAGKEARRDTKMMPTWAHEAFKAKTTKEIEALQSDLAKALGTAPGGAEGDGAAKPDALNGATLEKEAQVIADEHGITVELAKAFLTSAVRMTGIDTLAPKLEAIDALTATREAEVETAKFNADFDRIILPALKAEYGDEIPPETISKVREDLKELAYDPEGTYAKVPYISIFKGEDRFRDLIAPLKKGTEDSRGGATASAAAIAEGAVDLTQPLSDDVIRTLSHEHFETYMANMAATEKSKK